jgi:hypothetical protein
MSGSSPLYPRCSPRKRTSRIGSSVPNSELPVGAQVNYQGVLVAEWPSMEAAKAWYDSAGHKAIRHLRQDNGKYTGVLVEAGMAPPEERLRNMIR